MVIVYNEETLRKYMTEAVEASEERPVLIDRFLEDATELDVDCISDGETTVIGAVMEHVELAGIHSGDSACMIPTISLSKNVLDKIHRNTISLAKELHVCGLMNVQYAVKDEEVYVLEVNPRASRTIPFVSKSIGVPLAKLAALVMVGKKLRDMGFTKEVIPEHYCCKEAVFPFVRFPGIDVVLSPEMKSTGEVMGIDVSPGLAYFKTQVAAGNSIPDGGDIFMSIRSLDKHAVVLWPKVEADGKQMYFSAMYGAMASYLDASNDNVPSLYPSNKPAALSITHTSACSPYVLYKD